ncbi:MAG TPA: FAD-dependent oxidoreductase [Phycisphaerae bacterium]|nr:FAD-dependent oxidoreductase [Phycisphaerae bacterium]
MSEAKTYDVLVIGGGVAGVAAALQCARSGMRTALVEKTVLWGGLATTGLVPIYMPLCDGKGRQITFGIAEELLKGSIRYGRGDIPAGWAKSSGAAGQEVEDLYPEACMGKRYMTAFNPAAFALGLDEVLEDCGADLWLDTLACTPILEGGTVAGVEVENKSGRITIRAGCVIDASGDADIAARAGAPCQELGSFPSFLYQYSSLELAREAVAKGSAEKLVTWHGGGSANEFDKGYEGTTPRLSGVRGKEVSAFLIESRRIARQKLAAEQAACGPDGRKQLYPAALPAMAQIRMTRMIEGHQTVRTDQCNNRCEASVGLIADCRKIDAVWEVPYGALVPKGAANLLVVGRCVSAEGYAWQVTRLIPAAALTGQIAGVAAALAVRGRTSPNRLEVADVQRAVQDKGIVLHV